MMVVRQLFQVVRGGRYGHAAPQALSPRGVRCDVWHEDGTTPLELHQTFHITLYLTVMKIYYYPLKGTVCKSLPSSGQILDCSTLLPVNYCGSDTSSTFFLVDLVEDAGGKPNYILYCQYTRTY